MLKLIKPVVLITVLAILILILSTSEDQVILSKLFEALSVVLLLSCIGLMGGIDTYHKKRTGNE